MRKIARAVARARMRKAGLRKVNRRSPGGRSYFVEHWREWARR